jgi:hypothetical protein
MGLEQPGGVVLNAQKLTRIIAASLVATATVQAADEVHPAPSELSVWQHHQTTIYYYGITTRYTCDGLEDKVRALLLYFGARADLKVHAFGCERAPDRPTRTASVSTDFYSLAAADVGASQTVPGQWVGFIIMPRRPNWMGDGECELMDQLKALLTKSFSMRNLDYRTSCFPNQITIADYNIKGEILKPAADRPG